MEGVGLILSLKGSAKNQQQFPKLFIGTIAVISLFMACKYVVLSSSMVMPGEKLNPFLHQFSEQQATSALEMRLKHPLL